jgi:hypothetical protein
MPIIPSVTMNGISRSRVTSKPETTPVMTPKPIAPAAATSGGAPASKSSASTTAERAMIDPNDKSTPPEITISVMPIAPMPITAVCCSMIAELSHVTKRSKRRIANSA